MSAMVHIFSWGERWSGSIQRGEVKLNRTFHLSLDENSCAIVAIVPLLTHAFNGLSFYIM